MGLPPAWRHPHQRLQQCHQATRQLKPETLLNISGLVHYCSDGSTLQKNPSQYNYAALSNASHRPVAEDTYLMLVDHSKLEWSFAVNV
ncbi:LOW QUALITY PROTEIN: Glucose transporter [Phytophthora megakarya]|uniref:Glucose transporter n=1 Tax=Phytophthora megakarya TaxID=4795 RepID=A0A225WBC2_9STRA|nr:LOW QUALITY PROTEIN: Glucose transporter [Phytophthora megakarya]